MKLRLFFLSLAFAMTSCVAEATEECGTDFNFRARARISDIQVRTETVTVKDDRNSCYQSRGRSRSGDDLGAVIGGMLAEAITGSRGGSRTQRQQPGKRADDLYDICTKQAERVYYLVTLIYLEGGREKKITKKMYKYPGSVGDLINITFKGCILVR